MNRSRITPLGLGLALACAATTAAADVVYYPDGYIVYDSSPAVRVERVVAPEVVASNDVYYTTTETPRVVETYVAPGNAVVVRSDPLVVTGTRYYSSYPGTHWDPRHPQWGHLIDHGLFNRTGPNDFGR